MCISLPRAYVVCSASQAVYWRCILWAVILVCSPLVHFVFKFYLPILERVHSGEGQRESQTDSTLSTERDAGLIPTTLRSRPVLKPRVRRSNSWATQVSHPLFHPLCPVLSRLAAGTCWIVVWPDPAVSFADNKKLLHSVVGLARTHASFVISLYVTSLSYCGPWVMLSSTGHVFGLGASIEAVPSWSS